MTPLLVYVCDECGAVYRREPKFCDGDLPDGRGCTSTSFSPAALVPLEERRR